MSRVRYFIYDKSVKDYHNKPRRFKEITEQEYIMGGQDNEEITYADVEVDVVEETEHSWLCSDGSKRVYIPKSLIADYDGEMVEGESVTVTIPEWFAKKEGLI